MTYQLVTQVASGAIAATFLVVALLILRGLLRARKLRSNALGLLVALMLGVVSSIVPARASIKTTVVEGLRELD